MKARDRVSRTTASDTFSRRANQCSKLARSAFFDPSEVAAMMNRRIILPSPDQIAKWVPGGLFTLGTDGFGRSDTRENLRRFFEVDAACIVIATLYALAEKGEISYKKVASAIRKLGVDTEKPSPRIL